MIPSSLGDTSLIRFLDLNTNQLSGEIPSSLGRIKSPTNIYSLATLDLSKNDLIGSIPSSLGDSSSLHTLILNNNHLSGSFPSSFKSLISLRYLDISHNKLSGSIPSTLELLPYLSSLILNNNSLAGPVPSLPSSITNCEVQNNTGLCAHPEISNKCTVGLDNCNMDCRMMNYWLPKMFDVDNCCSQSGIICVEDRISNLYVSFEINLL
jgi:Leucine-rich repeat (LRR) protein